MTFIEKLLNKRKGKPPFCSAVIAAAGSSQRMEGEDKLFIEICGTPVLAHTLVAFQNNDLINEIIVVASVSSFERISELCRHYNIVKATKIMAGGATRLDSVINGVLAVSKKAQLIAIHDAARPCVENDLIERTVSAAARYRAVAPAIPVSSTLKKVKDGIVIETVSREGLYEVQTPQVFSAEIIKLALTKSRNKSIEITDDCMAVELLGIQVYITEGSRSNIKLTTSDDITIAEAILGKGVSLCE